MTLGTFDPGDTIDIDVTFRDPRTMEEVSGVPDATIEVFKGNVQVLPPAPMVLISGGRFTYSYDIPALATKGTYTAYVTGTVGPDTQTATVSFAVSDQEVQIQASIDDVKVDIQNLQVDLDNQFDELKTDIGDPSTDGTTIYNEIKNVKEEIGPALSTGQNITEKLDDIRIAVGLGTSGGTVVVTGTVKDDNNVALEGIRVIAIDITTNKAFDTTLSNASGVYTINLNPGTYVLEFMKTTSVLRQTANITIPIGVTTFTVPLVRLATKRIVTDIIIDPDQNPIPGVLVKAILEANYDENDIDNQVEAAAFSDTAGIFTIELFPGNYIFQFVKTGYDTLPTHKTIL